MASYLGLRGASLNVAIGSVAACCFILFGYDQGDIGTLLTVPSFLREFPEVDTFNNPGVGYNARIQGIMVASWNIGCFISAILAIWLGDILGRRKTIFVGLFIMGIGEIIQASSYSLGQFIAGRVIAGFGNGFNTSTIPAWHAECCKAHRKGTVLMISAGSSIALGVALSQWIGFGFAYLEPSSASWRVPIAIQLVLPVIILAVIMLLPESPRWLILKGREDEALNALAALNDLPRNDPEVFSEFIAIKDAVLQMAAASPSGLFKMNEYRDAHRTVLAYCIQIFQQATGINLIVQYIALILLQQTRYSGWVARLLAACNGTEFFLASFIAVVGIDRFWGRRSLMMFGASGMCISMIIITVLRYVNDKRTKPLGLDIRTDMCRYLDNRGENIAATVFYFVFNTFFAIGWQGMAWLYTVEIVPLRIRGPANALSTSANWIVNFMYVWHSRALFTRARSLTICSVVLITPIAFNNIGYRTYIIFAAL